MLYDRVVNLVAEQCGVRASRITPDTTLFGDLGIDGDDGIEVLEKLAREFSVDMSRCQPCRYFGPEGFYPWAPLYWIVLAFRKGSPEERARLKPVTIADLVRSAELGRWTTKDSDGPADERSL